MTKTIWCHHDPDGLVSALMVSYAKPEYNIKVTDKFGDTSGWEKGDIMVDMRPDNPEIEGLVIDHHPGHEPLGIRKYELIWEHVPATIVAWRRFKDKIPKQHWWKVVVGAAGDGQVEAVPYEIFETCPLLLKDYNTYNGKYRGSWKSNFWPIYNAMSSGINSYCRYGRFTEPLDILRDAKDPLDIIENPGIRKQKGILRGDFEEAMSKAKIYKFPNLKLVLYHSEKCRLSGYIASVVEGQKDNQDTVLAINDVDGSCSMRGTLALYFRDIINRFDYIQVDGHPGFMGGHIDVHPIKLFHDLMEIL